MVNVDVISIYGYGDCFFYVTFLGFLYLPFLLFFLFSFKYSYVNNKKR